MPTIVLITGANRGLGLGLVQAYAAKPGHVVVAAVRDPASMPATHAADRSKVVVLKFDVGREEDARAAGDDLRKLGVDHLDIAIANAGLMEPAAARSRMEHIPADVFERHWRVNVLGALLTFQAAVPLMKPGGKFIFMSSGAGVIARVPDKNDVAYGISKSGDNYLARYADHEHPELVVFAMSPGWVQTDMGNLAARTYGGDDATAPLSLDDSVAGMVSVIAAATKDNYGGKHVRYDGSLSTW
ncbi:hypothetical protein Q5752_001389 [Cryptotrichosporon argae]